MNRLRLQFAQGFTLIEVLLALTIIAISLTALFKSIAENIVIAQRLKNKTMSHWVALQGVTMIQSGLLPVKLNQEFSQVTNIMEQRWYWRAKISPTPIKAVQQIIISSSQHQNGPFIDPLIAYQYSPL